jgi:hypothetical protein
MSAAKNPKEAGPRPPREEANTTTVRFEITLGWLRDLHRRVERRQLEDADWPFIGALVSKQIARAEGRQTRMLAKIAQDAAARKDEQGLDADVAGKAPNPPPESEVPANACAAGVASGSAVDANGSAPDNSPPAADAPCMGDPKGSDGGGGETAPGNSKAPRGTAETAPKPTAMHGASSMRSRSA